MSPAGMQVPKERPWFPIALIAVVVALFLLRGAQLSYYAGKDEGRRQAEAACKASP